MTRGRAREMAATLATLVVCTSCAGYRVHEGSGAPPEGANAAAETVGGEEARESGEVDELETLELELQQALRRTDAAATGDDESPLAADAPPDCNAAPELRDRICALAERICGLAADNAGDPALAHHCERARASCQQAREDVTAACGN